MSAGSSDDAQSVLERYLIETDAPNIEELLARHPEYTSELRRLWDGEQRVRELLGEALTGMVSEVSVFRPRGRTTAAQLVDAGENRAGDTLGDFELIGVLGRGGMGQVWVAEQRSLGRKVALKLVRPDRVNERTLAFFAREARAGGRLSHPGIVSVYDHGESEGVAWIAMELVEGGCNLRTSLDELAVTEELPKHYYEHVARFVVQLAEALQASHDAGVIHRDLKPSNVLVAEDDRAKLTDFGLARITDETALSLSGDLAGTYPYMSPEQIERRPGIDHRTDVFSLGVVLYELLTFQRPFQGDTAHQVAQQIVGKEPPSPREIRSRVPEDLAVICGKCLEKDPDRRFSSMTELADDLRRHLADEPIQAQPPTRLYRLVKWVRRHPARSASTVVAALALVVIAVVFGAYLTAARGERERELEVLSLSAPIDVARLTMLADDLWPAYPVLIPQYELWLERSATVVAELPSLRERLASVRAEAPSAEVPSAERSADGDQLAWWERELAPLIREVEQFMDPATGLFGEGVSPTHGWSVQRRLDAARRLRDQMRPGSEWSARWDSAIAEIRDLPRYGGLELAVQRGLVPLARNPQSGLWEFWHVQSGDEPTRVADGGLEIGPTTGIVLVLLPAGTFSMGAQSSDPSASNYSALATEVEGPVHTVAVDAFFFSKYETTQAQWHAMSGAWPSFYGPEGVPDAFPTLPVERVSWLAATQWSARFGLRLPTESEWEYAARGGTSSTWWFGDDPRDLEVCANIADEELRKQGQNPSFEYAPWNDGWWIPNFVWLRPPNPFGLHGIHGNVQEWTGTSTPSDLVPYLVEVSKRSDGRIVRGGNWQFKAEASSSARRAARPPEQISANLGVRMARSLDG